jgi:hypothetical protein
VLLKSERLENSATLNGTGRDISDFVLNLKFNSSSVTWELDNSDDTIEFTRPKSRHDKLFKILFDITYENEVWFGSATELVEEVKKRDSAINATISGITRILNSNQDVLYKDYNVVYGYERAGGDRIITLGIRKDEEIIPVNNNKPDPDYDFDEYVYPDDYFPDPQQGTMYH